MTTTATPTRTTHQEYDMRCIFTVNDAKRRIRHTLADNGCAGVQVTGRTIKGETFDHDMVVVTVHANWIPADVIAKVAAVAGAYGIVVRYAA